MKEPGLFGDSLPEGVPPELTVSELEEMACRQQQQIESQRQLLAAKEQRLRFLKQHEAKHQQVAAEHERLRRLRDRVEAQEQKLRKLRALRGQVDQTKLNNASLTSDLESIRALFNEKEKELSVAVAKVEELTLQLEELQRGRNSNSGQMPPSSAAVELEKLRAELMYRNKLNEQQSARLSHQREVLAQRQEEVSAIDRRIAELQSRLHRKRLLNQQLASHINKQGQQPNQNAAPNHQQQPQFQPIFQHPVSQHQKQQQMKHHQQMMQAQKQQNQTKLQQSQIPPSMYYQINTMNKNGMPATNKNVSYPGMTTGSQKTSCPSSGSGRLGPNTNIAAVEPYHHVPSHGYQPSLDVKRSHRKSDPQPLQQDQSHQRKVSHYPSHNQKDVAKVSPNSNEEQRLHQDDDRNRSGDSNDPSKEERLPEFWPNKFDSKYQTLPSGTKFAATNNVNAKYILRRPGEGVESNSPQQNAQENTNQKVTERKYSSEDNFNNNVKENQLDDKNNNGNADSGKNTNANVGNQPTVQQNTIVRSIPIASNSNKGLATTPMSNINYLSRTTCSTATTSSISRCHETSPYNNAVSTNQFSKNAQTADNDNSITSPVTASSTAVTFTSTYQKPVSSVSPIYQTSSTRIQPVQPQVIGSLANTNQEYRKNYSQNGNTQSSSVENQTAKPALPPKPAQPVKATPPPPPRQSAFHTQYTTISEPKSNEARTYFGDFGGRGENNSDSHSSGSEKEQSTNERRLFANGGSVDLSSELNALSIMSRNDNSKHQSESPPPLPSVEPPSDDEVDRSMKLKTIYVQNSVNSHHRSKNINRVHQLGSISDRLMSDLSQDSSSSDTSSAENNYFVGTNRRIELPPAYLFPENETPPRDLVNSNCEKDMESSDDTSDHRSMMMNNTSSSSDQMNVDNASDNDKFSLISSSPDSENTEKMNTLNKELQFADDIKKIKKGNLKNNNSVNSKRRVSFDPLALLLDASLEGELELVKRTASEVKNPSAANDEGITALHNAICAGHFEIVQFLVEFGCDVNAQDSDGWTPLHCAASCNNLPMVRFLVEHGACIFATTLSDQETAAEKCEEDEEGYDGCSQFLYSVQEKLGILNNGIVYAVFDYEAHNPDELNFKEGDRLTVLRKGDEWEREWWWSRLNDKEGYIPRNLLGLYPRTHPNTNKKIQD